MENEKRLVSKNYIGNRERYFSLFYVSICFIVLLSISCFFFLRNNSNSRIFARKDKLVTKMEQVENFKKLQRSVALQCDTLYANIKKFKPDVYSSYDENDIRYELNELKGIYLKNDWDRRYKMFEQISTLYDMWLTDRKDLWCKKQNLNDLALNLQECEMGLQRARK